MSSLQGNRTTIRLRGQNTKELSFNRGVKQGDPISPILFNIVMDEFVEASNARGHGGTIHDNIKVASLAFADDVVLMEDSPEQMMVSLDRARKFLQDRGMEMNPSKCFSATTMRHRGSLKKVTRSTFSVNNKNIPAVSGLNPARYLGHNVCFHGILKANIQHLDQ